MEKGNAAGTDLKGNTVRLQVIILVAVAAMAYLPLVNRIGYSYDDWYLMPAARAEGANVFHAIFGVDRPGRAYLMIPAYRVFGEDPLYYHISAFVFRVGGALALFRLLNMLWAGRQARTLLMSLLFLTYPGFLSQPNAIDYQSHLFGLMAALGSISLTVSAIRIETPVRKASVQILSVLLGWLYLSQMEWYIGFEVFRWACVFLMASRSGGKLIQIARRTLRWAYPSLAAPLFFLIWRLFIFRSERGATDTEIQFEQLRLYPIQTIYHWVVQVFQDLNDVILSAWTLPLSQLADQIQRWGGLLAVLTGALLWLYLSGWGTRDADADNAVSVFAGEATWLGLLGAIGGLIPVVMVNREVAYPFYSRYSLVSSVGVSILIVAMIARLDRRILRNTIAAVLVAISLLTHHANAVRYAQGTSELNTFWWQVAWRIPQIALHTTLIADYPTVGIEEDYFVWGPASLIYYPEKQNADAIQPGVYAAVLNNDAVTKILTREPQRQDIRKNIRTYPNFRNILVLTQPTPRSCVHVIDGAGPVYSAAESDSIRLIGSHSEVEHVLVDAPQRTPPVTVFGAEPARGWCYYYEKADLARQRGDWMEVLSLGEAASRQGLFPQDDTEWTPFLQAYAVTGDLEQLRETMAGITAQPYVLLQACHAIGSLPDISRAVQDIAKASGCPE